MALDWLLDGVFGWLAQRLQNLLSWLLGLLTSRFFTSPDVTVLPQVQALAERSGLVVSAAFVIAIMVAGMLAMTHGSLQVQYAAKDLIPRLVIGFCLSAFSMPLCRVVIEVANALTTALVGEAASGPRTVEYVRKGLLASMTDPAMRALTAVIALIIVVLIFQLVFSWFARICTLLVLTGVASLALACYALPQTQPVAQLWWRLFLGALVTPALQGVAFSVGIDLLLDPDHNLPATIFVGMPAAGGLMVINLFFVACLLMVTVRIPRLVAHYAIHRPPAGPLGVITRAVLVRGLLRRVPGLGRLVP